MITHVAADRQSSTRSFAFNPYRTLTTEELLRERECWQWMVAEVRADRDVMEPEVFANSVAYCLDRLALVDEDVARRDRLREHPAAPAWPSIADRRDELDRIKAAARIEDLIYHYAPVQFRKAGSRLVCRCPLPGHPDDDTPSFTVYPDQGRWWCFGCGRGGDCFEFVRQHLQVGGFRGAVDLVASMVGIKRPRSRPPVVLRPVGGLRTKEARRA